MKNQSEPEKQVENQISKKYFYNVSDLNWKSYNTSVSESWFLQRVRFWMEFCLQRVKKASENFTTCQIKQKLLHSKNHAWTHFSQRSRQFLQFRASSKSMIY